jgi:uncharacterized membrane protein
MMKFKHWDYYLAVLYLLAFLVASILLSVNRWWQLEHFYFNHGLFETALWQVAHGQSPLIDHFEFKMEHQLGDHFSPTLYLLSVLFIFFDSYLVLPILKALLITTAGAITWWLSTKLVASKIMRLVLLICFTGFIGLQNALIGDFALEMIAIVTLAAAVYALETKQWPWFWSWLFLTGGVKESMGAVGVGLGCYLLVQKEYKRGLLTIIASILYTLLVIKVAIPYFGNGYIYFDRTDPLTLVSAFTRFILPPIKVDTMITSTAYFGWLPLVSPATLPLLMQDFYVRFVFGESPNWDLGLYYSSMTSVIMYLGSVKTVQWLEKYRWYRKVELGHAIVLLLLVAFLSYRYRPPLLVVFNRDFYRHTQQTQFLRDFVTIAKNAIPPSATVMTQNNIASILTHSHKVILLRSDYQEYQPDVIMIDLRGGQNPNNFWPVLDIQQLQTDLANDSNYRLEKISDEQVLYWKN